MLFTSEITSISAFAACCNEHGFRIKNLNGHNVNDIYDYIEHWRVSDQPSRTLIIADTIKGKGFKHLQNSPL